MYQLVQSSGTFTRLRHLINVMREPFMRINGRDEARPWRQDCQLVTRSLPCFRGLEGEQTENICVTKRINTHSSRPSSGRVKLAEERRRGRKRRLVWMRVWEQMCRGCAKWSQRGAGRVCPASCNLSCSAHEPAVTAAPLS